MYWYFDKGGDNDMGDYQSALQATTLQIHKNLNFQLPFFGFRFNYTRVRPYSLVIFNITIIELYNLLSATRNLFSREKKSVYLNLRVFQFTS